MTRSVRLSRAFLRRALAAHDAGSSCAQAMADSLPRPVPQIQHRHGVDNDEGLNKVLNSDGTDPNVPKSKQ